MQSEPFKRLLELVAITGSCNEIACGEVLADHFAAVLLPHDETIVLVDKQYFTDSGRTDIVVIGDRTNLDGTEERLGHLEAEAFLQVLNPIQQMDIFRVPKGPVAQVVRAHA